MKTVWHKFKISKSPVLEVESFLTKTTNMSAFLTKGAVWTSIGLVVP